MQYMGSKSRHAESLISIMQPSRYPAYVEPFVGGANLIDKVECPTRIGCDVDADLICLWKEVSKGWMPPLSITEEEYRVLKLAKEPSPLRGYAAFALSFGGKKFGGWSRDKQQSDYSKRGYTSATKQFPKLLGVQFFNCSYEFSPLPEGALVYCDPPYIGTTKYSSKFDHEAFWGWVRKTSQRHHVYVSEYLAPNDFTCVWEKQTKSGIRCKNTSEKTEKLFTFI